MTVNELINWLQDFDGDTEVVIAEYQSRGATLPMMSGKSAKIDIITGMETVMRKMGHVYKLF